jgi:hypothetical protein
MMMSGEPPVQPSRSTAMLCYVDPLNFGRNSFCGILAECNRQSLFRVKDRSVTFDFFSRVVGRQDQKESSELTITLAIGV